MRKIWGLNFFENQAPNRGRVLSGGLQPDIAPRGCARGLANGGGYPHCEGGSSMREGILNAGGGLNAGEDPQCEGWIFNVGGILNLGEVNGVRCCQGGRTRKPKCCVVYFVASCLMYVRFMWMCFRVASVPWHTGSRSARDLLGPGAIFCCGV